VRRSGDRILTTHTGSLPRPAEVTALVAATERSQQAKSAEYDQAIAKATARVLAQQIDAGLDIVNDGEVAKSTWHDYIIDRVSGIEVRPCAADARRIRREQPEFPEFYRAHSKAVVSEQFVCVGPIKYTGHASVAADIAQLKAAADGQQYTELFMSALTPAALGVDAAYKSGGKLDYVLKNEYYPSTEEMLLALGEALREEYEAIAGAGLVLQLDDPALCKLWAAHPEYDLPAYLRAAEQTIDGLNYALRNVPREQVRQHVCWGAGPGPHSDDIPLRTVVDLMLKVNCGAYGVEGANPRHEHEWKIWQDVKLPDGAILMPGVVTAKTNIVEHPEVVADRILRYTNLLGQENVIAGTDCGMADVRIHRELAWAKLRALSEGAKLASRQLGADVD
jgi:5-methyltetrahydropteroyltriglutamate--homocysteine methyltransferase